MEFLADTWVMWFVLSGVAVGLTYFYRRNRKQEGGFLVSAEDFSIRRIMLDVRKGEGDLFLGFLASMAFFSMGVAGLIRFIRSMF
jgi:hypothetical protein